MKIVSHCILLWIAIFYPFVAIAYDDAKTHPKITVKAISASNLNPYLQGHLGLEPSNTSEPDTLFDNESVTQLIQEGSELEDQPRCRASNHFHNPLMYWWLSGLSDTWWLTNGYCFLEWGGVVAGGVVGRPS